MKLSKFSKLSSFLSVAIISSSLLTVGCSKEDNLQELEQCKVNFSKQNYTEAFKYCKKSAEQGHEEAQFNLGYMYQYGQGIKQDYFKAVELYQKAAEQGYAKAQFILGLIFFEGKNYSKAKEYFGLACDNKYQAGCDMYRKLNK